MNAGTAALVDAATWAGWGVAVGLVAARLPAAVFQRDRWLTRIRRWERQGRVWARLGVRRWKDHLPEAGAVFGGVSKRVLPGRTDGGLAAFEAETRRAEYVHWAALGPLAVMPWWNPPWLMVGMAVYAAIANGPCIVVQRYNRGRTEAILQRRLARLPVAVRA